VRFVLLAFLVACSAPAAAQMFKCVDAKGRTHYTDKPLPGCKGGQTDMQPELAPKPKPAAAPQASGVDAKKKDKSGVVEGKKAKPRADVVWVDPKQQAAWCRGLRQEEAALKSSRNEHRDARLGQVRQALRACP
jgi:hypothetical protein